MSSFRAGLSSFVLKSLLMVLLCGLFLSQAATVATAYGPMSPSERQRHDMQRRLVSASAWAKTLSADFVYTVTSAKQQQLVRGEVRMMKPNLARFRYDFMANPAFPSPIAADGEKLYTFTPSSFKSNRTFTPGPYDSLLGAQQASGLIAGGGKITNEKLDPNGRNILLWDAAPIQAFFDPEFAIRRHLYAGDLSELIIEDPVDLDGVAHDVIYHFYRFGNIAGKEKSSFHQRLYVAPDGIIRMYVLEFESAGARGTQVMRLKNVRINEPMDPSEFAFVSPEPAVSAEE